MHIEPTRISDLNQKHILDLSEGREIALANECCLDWYFYTALLVLVTPAYWLTSLMDQMGSYLLGQDGSIEELQRDLSEIIQQNSPNCFDEILNSGILKKMAKELPEENFNLILDFLAIEELRPYIQDILFGANVKLKDPGDIFFEKLKAHPSCYSRISSHEYQAGSCYGISGKLFREVTFWKDPDGNLRFQIENYPHKCDGLHSISNVMYHFVDYLRYKRDHLQQSQFGTSQHTENNCLEIDFDFQKYQQNLYALMNAGNN